MRVLQIESDRSVTEAAQLLTVFDTSALQVQNQGKTLGIVTERDMVQLVLALRRNPEQTTLAELLK